MVNARQAAFASAAAQTVEQPAAPADVPVVEPPISDGDWDILEQIFNRRH